MKHYVNAILVAFFRNEALIRLPFMDINQQRITHLINDEMNDTEQQSMCKVHKCVQILTTIHKNKKPNKKPNKNWFCYSCESLTSICYLWLPMQLIRVFFSSRKIWRFSHLKIWSKNVGLLLRCEQHQLTAHVSLTKCVKLKINLNDFLKWQKV